MKIAVCIKLVPSTTALIRVAASGLSLDLAGVELVLSPYDELALEEALRTREKFAGSELLALSIGGHGATRILEHAYALGVDRALLVKAVDLDARAAARCAAAALKSFAPDLVFCGRQAIDDDQWLFPGALAEWLDLPHVTALSSFELDAGGGKATCRRRIEGGEECIELRLPAVVSCDKGLNDPRSPTLKGRLNSKKKPITIQTPADLGLDAAALAPAFQISGYAPPPAKSPGRVLSSPPQAAAAELARLLREEAKVI